MGECAKCNQAIIGQVITAMGKTWHPDHFTCYYCKGKLGTGSFFEKDGQPYCSKDYHNLFAPRCSYCNEPIVGKWITALDRKWHPEHFFCTKCKQPFGEDGFHEKDGKPYCRDDYLDLFAPKCAGCKKPVQENYVTALNKEWHPDCFVCAECNEAFGDTSFFEWQGAPYCKQHYLVKKGKKK